MVLRVLSIQPGMRSPAIAAFLVSFVGGLWLAALLAFFFIAPGRNRSVISRLVISLVLVPSFIAVPWGVYNLLLLLAIRSAFAINRRWCSRRYPFVGLACGLVLSSASMHFLLQEEKNCDSICLGLDIIIGGIPLWRLIAVVLSLVGVLQATLYERYRLLR